MFADRGIVWTQKRVRLLFFTQIAWDGWRPTGSCSSMRAIRSCNAGLSGSTVTAKRALAKVYSWPEHTVVVSGNARVC